MNGHRREFLARAGQGLLITGAPGWAAPAGAAPKKKGKDDKADEVAPPEDLMRRTVS